MIWRPGIPFPVILKPSVREGRNAFVDAKAWRVDRRQRTLPHVTTTAKALVDADSIMIQELIPATAPRNFPTPRCGTAAGLSPRSSARRRRQYPIEFGFTSTFVETVERPEIEAAAARFLDSLGYSGLVEIEFKFDARDRNYKILDVNARTWTWIALGAAAGIDFPRIQWSLGAGEEIARRTARSGVTWRYLSRDLVASGHEMLIGRLSPLGYLRLVAALGGIGGFRLGRSMAGTDRHPAQCRARRHAAAVAPHSAWRRRAAVGAASVLKLDCPVTPKAQSPSSGLRHFRGIERRRAFRHRQSFRQVHGEARAFAFLAHDIDAAVMQIDRQFTR